MSFVPNKLLLAIPMKDPADAKTRLAVALSPPQRAQLAIGLFGSVVERVKSACAQRPDQDVDIAVISSSPTICKLAAQLDLKWIDDGKANGLSTAVQRAAITAHEERYTSLCILPGDLADPKISDIATLLDHAEGSDKAVICPSKDFGTNALLLPLPSPIRFQYGERSFHHHYQALVDQSQLTTILPLTSLRRDVDTIRDFQDLQSERPDLAAWSERR